MSDDRSNWKTGFMLFLIPFSLFVISVLPDWVTVFIFPEFIMVIWLIFFMILVWRLTD